MMIINQIVNTFDQCLIVGIYRAAWDNCENIETPWLFSNLCTPANYFMKWTLDWFQKLMIAGFISPQFWYQKARRKEVSDAVPTSDEQSDESKHNDVMNICNTEGFVTPVAALGSSCDDAIKRSSFPINYEFYPWNDHDFFLLLIVPTVLKSSHITESQS